MTTIIILAIILDVAFLISAAVILKGKGDWMISNYRSLPADKKARINIGRLRTVVAIMLVFMAIMMPLNLFATTEAQHLAASIVTGLGLLVLLLVAHFWAGYPLAVNPFRK